MQLDNAILIGTGALNWDGHERRSDRYGTITLHNENADDQIISKNAHLKDDVIRKYQGENGKLVAEVLETRQSTHIGDLFRGFTPTTPNVGEVILIGEGKLFTDRYSWATAVGLLPKDGRETDWLNPESLYRCHEQTVNLYFIKEN